MSNMDLLIVLIPALPLIGCLLTAVFGTWLRQNSHWPVFLAIAGSFVCSVMLAVQVKNDLPAGEPDAIGYQRIVHLWTWIDVGSLTEGQEGELGDAPLNVDICLRTDPLTIIMLLMVTFISMWVVLYAGGYMHGDRSYWRFFAYVGLFVFSMTMLVSVSNFLLVFVFWEAVGVCSYLLIGFWYEKKSAAAAGMKAFLVNRVGDIGFTLGMFLIFVTYGTLNFHDSPGAPGVLGQIRLDGGAGGYVAGGVGLAICLLVMFGACGKSAQFPLHVWLADAMEGPTPVSALIHAATMVTAGVYLVARCTPLFLASPTASLVVASIGGVTALMASLIALTQFDLKRVLAFSTISQLGYMFMGLGIATMAGIASGMFHLFTHAFFKALLFLGAGSVMHAMGGVIDMRKFGGLRKVMPITHLTFLVGCLALAGIAPFSGFWSKDAILGSLHDQSAAIDAELSKRPGAGSASGALGRARWADTEDVAQAMRWVSTAESDLSPTDLSPTDGAHGGGHVPVTSAHLGHLDTAVLRNAAGIYRVLFNVAVFTAFLTAVYSFRMYYLTFYGEEEIPDEAAGHAHESPASMWVPLCVLASFAFAIGYVLHRTHVFHDFLAYTPSFASDAVRLTPQPGHFHKEIAVTSTIVAVAGSLVAAYFYLGPLSLAGRLASLFSIPWLGAPYLFAKGKFFWDEIYDGLVVRPLHAVAQWSYTIDRKLIDGFVDFVGWIPRAFATSIRGLQMGFIPFYALAMVLGILSLVAVKALMGGV